MDDGNYGDSISATVIPTVDGFSCSQCARGGARDTRFGDADVAYGSFTSFRRPLPHVCFAPNSDRRADIDLCRRRANKRDSLQLRTNAELNYSITSSARPSSVSGTVRPSVLAV